ncbi:drug/metabolite transporter (DMT)-like permease [Angulomicrobium tetraedrale]|uniref:Drug/metabolite transporter (DMT)-like permease n=1 Tax=Ancylobacter tetraedralis TaxID=217068 RepID=A0A839ZEP9_9HYPH|nr:DMT family transporter [Ancylobacter tetraedralis]MBB3773178.1 drug/metabolite transporter (DMT)-like permease [Ancylobacter tetraedralis]
MAFVADMLTPLVSRTAGSARQGLARSPAGLAVMALSGAALLWSGNFLAGHLAAGLIPPATLSAARWLLALLLLLPFTWREIQTERAEIARRWPLWIAAGVLNIAVFTVLIYLGLAHTSLVNGSIIGSAAPIVVGLFGWLILAERTGLRTRLALAISTAGVALIVLRGDIGNLARLDLHFGDLMLFLGISAFALYAVLLKRFPTRLSAAAALTVSIPFGLIALAPIAAWEIAAGGLTTGGLSPADLGHAALIVLYVASLPTLGFVLWGRGVAVLGPTRAGQFLQLVPVFGTALAVGVLGEALSLHHALGFALVLGGLALCDRRLPQSARG